MDYHDRPTPHLLEPLEQTMRRLDPSDLGAFIDLTPAPPTVPPVFDRAANPRPTSRSVTRRKPLSVTLPHSPSICPSCGSGGRVTVTADAVPPGSVILARYDAAGHTPARVLMPCPVCDDGRERAAEYARSRSKVPPSSDAVRLDAHLSSYPHQAPAVAAVLQLLQRRHGWLTLIGGYGTGKTTLLLATLNHLRDGGIVGGYWTAAELVDYLRFHPDQPDASDIRLARLQQAPALVIDELDKYRSTTFAEESVFKLLNYRHQQRATLITLLGTNDEEAIPPALRSRLRDTRCTVVAMGETDVRQAQYETVAARWERGEGEA